MHLYNTMTSATERFVPRDNEVKMYVCGVTPYDTTHAGHAFTYLTFDVLKRYLEWNGVKVVYVQNVTDIDDDILRKAKEVGIPWDELGRRETAKFLKDIRDLNIEMPTHYVLATDHIADMLAIVKDLIANGNAYEANGSVYFSVASDPEFGKLSHIPRDKMLAIANERGNNPDDPNKRDPLDFILWQASAPGEPSWESPYGPGRPGWHIECSAMATHFLGPEIDIHGGGGDLVFPHHECEIAQTENAFKREPFCRVWMHVGMVEYQGEKMSKSLGNLVRVGDVLKDYHPDSLRLYLLSNHYRTPWEYVDDAIDEWADVARDLREAVDFPAYGTEEELDVSVERKRFLQAMDDDLNTP
ncbi:MAG: cysteine--tRNA ligase, partial [Chloroflexota bacterium]